MFLFALKHVGSFLFFWNEQGGFVMLCLRWSMWVLFVCIGACERKGLSCYVCVGACGGIFLGCHVMFALEHMFSFGYPVVFAHGMRTYLFI